MEDSFENIERTTQTTTEITTEITSETITETITETNMESPDDLIEKLALKWRAEDDAVANELRGKLATLESLKKKEMEEINSKYQILTTQLQQHNRETLQALHLARRQTILNITETGTIWSRVLGFFANLHF